MLYSVSTSSKDKTVQNFKLQVFLYGHLIKRIYQIYFFKYMAQVFRSHLKLLFLPKLKMCLTPHKFFTGHLETKFLFPAVPYTYINSRKSMLYNVW